LHEGEVLSVRVLAL